MVGEILPLFLIIMGVLETNYNQVMDKPLRVLSIFNEFFGEDRVDMQGFPTLEEVESSLPKTSSSSRITNFITSKISDGRGFILVHFPHVRITNEYDRFVDANEFYAKVIFDLEGKIIGKFLLNRADYSTLHFRNDYMHSHICNIPKWDFEEFQTPCTGTGPINRTICSLAREFDEDLWRLFCLELDKFMCVESVSGTPYHRLESLTETRFSRNPRSYIVYNKVNYYNILPNICSDTRGESPFSTDLLKEFITVVIDSQILKFNYDGSYSLGMTSVEYYTKISNLFIKWYNAKIIKGEVSHTFSCLFDYAVLTKVKFSDGNFKYSSDYYDPSNYTEYIGSKICTFKGQTIRLTIESSQDRSHEDNDVYLLNQEIADYIITLILNTINYTYGNNQYKKDSPHKAVYFV